MESPAAGADDGTALFDLLYVSEHSSGDASDVGRICHQSRVNNERDGITGLLVFDGHAFCQFVEGPRAAVVDLRDRLERDPRHRHMRVIFLGPSAWPRRFTSWRCGYSYVADPAAIARIATASGDAAVAAFRDWVPTLHPTDSAINPG